MTRLNEVERAALEDLFIGLPNTSVLQKMVVQFKKLFFK